MRMQTQQCEFSQNSTCSLFTC